MYVFLVDGSMLHIGRANMWEIVKVGEQDFLVCQHQEPGKRKVEDLIHLRIVAVMGWCYDEERLEHCKDGERLLLMEKAE